MGLPAWPALPHAACACVLAEGGILGSSLSIFLVVATLALIVPFAVHAAILASLPAKVGFTPAPDVALPRPLESIVEEYEELGFERAGPALTFHLPNKVLLVPFWLPGRGLLGSAYRIATTPPRLGYDVVSVMDAHECGLTTGMDHAAGVLPGTDGQLRQIFPGASVRKLYARHVEALHLLHERGLAHLEVQPDAIPALIADSFRINREAFLRARARNTFLALARTITKRNPFMGPLARQPRFEGQLKSVLAGRSAPRVREPVGAA